MHVEANVSRPMDARLSPRSQRAMILIGKSKLSDIIESVVIRFVEDSPKDITRFLLGISIDNLKADYGVS